MASPAISAISKMSNDDIRRLPLEDLVKLLRKSESDRLLLLAEHNNLMKDVNRKMQVHILEIRSLKEVNQKLHEDNKELRDLCCFLDDDRQKHSKMAHEWQRFGRYTANVMKSEVALYQEKLKELEKNQEDMLKENIQLKELCIYLDSEGNEHNCSRNEESQSKDGLPAWKNDDMKRCLQQQSAINGQTLKYIKSLEKKLEYQESLIEAIPGEAIDASLSTSRYIPSHQLASPLSTPWDLPSHQGKFFSTPLLPTRTTRHGSLENLLAASPFRDRTFGVVTSNVEAKQELSTSKPEAVVHALKVLEVHEQLENLQQVVSDETDMGDPEKALLREMCNVVWRKLEEGSEN